MTDEIPEAELANGRVYELQSRNLAVGVWHAEKRAFVGLREKFKERYLFAEYHWDCGPPYGTARATRLLEGITADGYDLNQLESLTSDDRLFQALDALDREITRYRVLDWSLRDEWAVQYWNLETREEPAREEKPCRSLHVARGMQETYSRHTTDTRHHEPRVVTRRTTPWREVKPDEPDRGPGN